VRIRCAPRAEASLLQTRAELKPFRSLGRRRIDMSASYITDPAIRSGFSRSGFGGTAANFCRGWRLASCRQLLPALPASVPPDHRVCHRRTEWHAGIQNPLVTDRQVGPPPGSDTQESLPATGREQRKCLENRTCRWHKGASANGINHALQPVHLLGLTRPPLAGFNAPPDIMAATSSGSPRRPSACIRTDASAACLFSQM